MSKEENQRDSDKNRSNLQILLVALGVLVSMIALYYSWQANQIANEANKIAEEQQRPLVSVSHQFSFQRWDDQLREPCLVSPDTVRWETEFVAAFDLTNSGGAAISLTRINFSPRLDVTTTISTATSYVWLSYFSNREELRQWYFAKQGPSETQLLPSIDQSVATGPPIKVEHHATVRLMLHGLEQATFDKHVSAQETHDQIRKKGDWTTTMQFTFDDTATQDLTFAVPHPYSYWEPSQVQITPFAPCN